MSNLKRDLPCPIWGTTIGTIVEKKPGVHKVNISSPRADGNYMITEAVLKNCPHLSKNQNEENLEFKAKLTTWLVNQRAQGNNSPLINHKICEKINKTKGLRIIEKIDRVLIKIYALYRVPIDNQIRVFNLKEENQLTQGLMAHSESVNNRELCEIAGHAVEKGYLRKVSNGYVLKINGIERAETLLSPGKNSRQAFVAMWFDKSMDDVYEKAIEPAIEKSGYKPLKINNKEYNNKIDDEIIKDIKRSRFLISDFTCEKDKVRGSVYYEAGFAHGMGIPVIFMCKEDSEDSLHFDTRQYNHIIWKNNDDLKKKLYDRIGATIGHIEDVNDELTDKD